MRKLLLILFLFIGSLTYGQTVFTQTYVDRCTGDVKVVVANFQNGSATVAFYDRVRTFTYQEFLAGELQQWLTETYTWWQALSPCSTATSEAQNAQQTAQNATAAASTASSAASTAANSASSAATNPPPATGGSTTQSTSSGGTTNGTSNNTSSGDTNSTSNTENQNTDSSGTSESSQSETGDTSSGGESSESSGGGETSESEGGQTEETSEGSGESESKEESKTEESKEEEVKEESKEEEKKEEESKEEESEEESSEEESEEDSEDSESDEEEEKEKKQKKMMPIQLRSDMMANQALLGNYDIVTSIGATQSSIYGDESYGATAMIWSNLRQFSLNTSYTKVHMTTPDVTSLVRTNGKVAYSEGKSVKVTDSTDPILPKLSHITSASVGYMNNFGNGTIVANMMKIKPTKWGTFGAGINMANMFGEGKYQTSMIGYNVLYTNQVMLNSRINYAPAFIWTQSPYMGKFDGKNVLKGTRIHGMMILANSFTIQLTRRFSFNAGATFIKSTDPNIPLIKSFMIGAKLPF